jgi:hypothetical protein
MTIVSPSYELWQQENTEIHFSEHSFDLSKMNKSGALVDIVKMEQVNREYLSRLSNLSLYKKALERSLSYHEDFATLLQKDPDGMTAAMGIERHTPKDPKRFARYTDVYDQIQCFDDELFLTQTYPELGE